ncbi:MAG: hypothetical protein ABI234_01465, partial [Ktedonobacteraceae bacterium]
VTNAATPTYASDGLLSLGAFMASQTQEPAYAPSTQHAYTGQWPQFNTPTPDASQATRLPGLVLPSRPTQQPGAAAPNPLHRTRLLPSRPSTDQLPSFVPDPTTDKQPQLVGAGVGNGRSNGLLSRYRDVQSGQ